MRSGPNCCGHQLPGERLGRVDHAEGGIELRGDAVQHAQRREQHGELGGQVQLVLAHQREQPLHELVEAAAAPSARGGTAASRRPSSTSSRATSTSGGMPVIASTASVAPRGVVVEHREQHVEHGVAVALRHARRAPEVDEGDAPVGQREEVPGVRVGVVEAQLEDLPEVAAHAELDEAHAVDAGHVALLELRRRHAVDEGHGEHAARWSGPSRPPGRRTSLSSAKASRKRSMERPSWRVVQLRAQHVGELLRRAPTRRSPCPTACAR